MLAHGTTEHTTMHTAVSEAFADTVTQWHTKSTTYCLSEHIVLLLYIQRFAALCAPVKTTTAIATASIS
jgi:hypothetical protein